MMHGHGAQREAQNCCQMVSFAMALSQTTVAPVQLSGDQSQNDLTTGLIKTAAKLSRLVPPERLHSTWKKLPFKLRERLNRPKTAPTESERAAQDRNAAFRSFISQVDKRISPSRYLARKAERFGMGSVEVIPHGAPSRLIGKGGQGFVFIGTISQHEGQMSSAKPIESIWYRRTIFENLWTFGQSATKMSSPVPWTTRS